MATAFHSVLLLRALFATVCPACHVHLLGLFSGQGHPPLPLFLFLPFSAFFAGPSSSTSVHCQSVSQSNLFLSIFVPPFLGRHSALSFSFQLSSVVHVLLCLSLSVCVLFCMHSRTHWWTSHSFIEKESQLKTSTAHTHSHFAIAISID